MSSRCHRKRNAGRRHGHAAWLAAAIVLFAVGCAGGQSIPEIESIGNTGGSGSSSLGDSEPLGSEEAGLQLQKCLEEGGLVLDPSGSEFWISAELAGEVRDGPIEPRHEPLVADVYAACEHLIAAIVQDSEPLDASHPVILEMFEVISSCMAEDGYEVQLEPDGSITAVAPDVEEGTPEFLAWDQKVSECGN